MSHLDYIVVPGFFLVLLYLTVSVVSWPYFRNVVPFPLFLLIFFLPPLFPFLFVYLLFVSLSVRPEEPHVVMVVQPSERGRIRPSLPSQHAATRI